MKKVILSVFLILFGFFAFAQQKQFTVYEAISGFVKKPSLTVDGLKHVRLFYQSSLITDNKLDEEKLEKWAIGARNSGESTACTFVDPWFLTRNFSPEEGAELIAKINAKFHEYSPKIKISTYALPVMVNYNVGIYRARLQNNDGYYMNTWRKANEALSKTCASCDMLYPSVYAVDNDMKQWEESLKITVDYCREIYPDKPVVPFIQMQYYNEKGSDFALEYIDAKTWTTMLETLYKYADGVVIYAVGRDVDNVTKVEWEDERVQNIYNATLKFMKKHKVNKPVKK